MLKHRTAALEAQKQERRFVRVRAACNTQHAIQHFAPHSALPDRPFMTDSMLRFARRGLCAILMACMPLVAFAALTADDLAPLAADDFDAKSAAVDKLIANADAPSIAVLNALSDGS